MRSLAVLICLTAFTIAACDDPKEKNAAPAPVASTPPAVAPSAAPKAAEPAAAAPAASAPAAVAAAAPIPPEATKIFNERCTLCHGKEGKGNGVGAMGMKPPPRNWTDGPWQASVTDEHIATVVLKGGGAVGKSTTMPASPDLEGKKATIDGLVQIVRSFKPAGTP